MVEKPPIKKRGRPPKARPAAIPTRVAVDVHAPASPAGASARELAEAEVRSLKTQLDSAMAAGVAAGELAKLRSGYLAAVRLLAQLTGQLAQREITPATIVRTPAWKKYLFLLHEILKKHPECWADLEAALHDYGSE